MRMPPTRLPNPLTALRLAGLPVLWVLALLNWQPALGIGLGLAALTDVLDGQLARRLPQFADGRFDSRADKLLTFSVVVWLVLLKPQLFTAHASLLLTATVIYAASLVYGWRKFGRVTALHLHSAKLGGLLQAVFVVHAFLTGGYSRPLLYLAVGVFILAAVEELLVQMAHPTLDDEAVRSILPYLRARLKRPAA